MNEKKPARPKEQVLEKWVGTAELAEHLGRTPRWVREYAPAMPHHRIGKSYRFRISEVERWIDQYWRGGMSPE